MRADAERAQTMLSGRIAIAVLLMAMSAAVVALVMTGLVAPGQVARGEVALGQVARGQEPSPDVDVGVRISAQRLENGHIRFGLRTQDGNGEWLAPVTPRAHRLDPANARTGRWLASSSMILEINQSGHGRVTRSERFESSSAREVVLVSGQDEWVGDVYYSAYHHDEGDLVTRASIYSASVGAPDGELRTTITCQDRERSVSIGGLPSHIGDGSANQQVPVSWSVDNGPKHTERSAVESAATGLELVQRTQSRLVDALMGSGSQLVLTIEATPPLTSSINLDAFRALPMYDNLRYCSGDAGQSGQKELRIRAQVRADQRIEFAVQQRTADGWSDNILPRARFMPAFGAATNWLSSTPIAVTVRLDTPTKVVLPEPSVQEVAEPITPLIRSGYFTASLTYEVEHRDLEGYWPTKLNSVVTVASDRELQLQVGCFGDERRVLLAGAPSDATGHLALAFDDAETNANWSVSLDDGSVSLTPADTERTIQRLRMAKSFSVRVGHGDSVPVSFATAGLFETPIQSNIDHCGNYAEPDWQPITTALNVGNKSTEYYAVHYNEWSSFQRDSHFQVESIEDLPAADDQPFTLLMTCNTRVLTFQLKRVPEGFIVLSANGLVVTESQSETFYSGRAA